MRPIAYLHCLSCASVTLFVLYAPTASGAWDEHECECSGCGYSYGYIDIEPKTLVDDEGRVTTAYASRPVLDEAVLREGIAKFQKENADRLIATYGPHATTGKAKAMRRYRAGMANPERRVELLNSTAPGLRK